MSPFKSHSQRKKFYAMLKRGEITRAEINEWERKTPKNIPERVKKRKTVKKKVVRKRRSR